MPTGRLRREAGEGQLPAVGDWVGHLPPVHDGDARIDAVLPRRSAFVRRAPGSRAGSQVIAANIDTLFVATSLNAELNPRRLERYVTMARQSGAEPVVLLTKADLPALASHDADDLARQLGVPVAAVSARSGSGLDELSPWLVAGRTVALVGSSGVGKSTLLNRLAGTELMATRDIREDDARGRHTTTHRELFRLASDVLVLDTPGMRELGVWDAEEGLDETFADIAELASRCRFSDCGHEREPGCAVTRRHRGRFARSRAAAELSAPRPRAGRTALGRGAAGSATPVLEGGAPRLGREHGTQGVPGLTSRPPARPRGPRRAQPRVHT